ncbi:MAG: ABC transporter ATP-binding protein [Planctomycetota bacterium]
MSVQTGAAPLLDVRGLKKYFPVKKGVLQRTVAHVQAVDDIDLSIPPGGCLGLVGESGCGKTTTGRAILRLIEPDDGWVFFDGVDVVGANKRELRRLRREMQIIFQDPFSSLNPRFTVGGIVGEGLKVFERDRGRTYIRDRIAELLDIVGLPPDAAGRYPHEFSGGQRQRIGIARALALNPKFIVCDEPVSALDVSIQAQVINLLEDLQDEFGLAYLFIAHDLSIVRHISDEIAVMYLGWIVERGPAEEVCEDPLHPYTKALLSAIPVPDPHAKPERIVLEGDVPTPINPPPGCRFCPRCAERDESVCPVEAPKLREVRPGRFARCHRVSAGP